MINALAALSSTQYYLFRFVSPVVIFLGTVGCIINLTVFTQKILRKNTCSVYFIAYNIGNFIYIYAAPFYVTLNVGYSIDASIQYLVLCRLRFYTTVLLNCLCSFYLVMASIDRVLITSSNARTRQKSTLRMAYVCVIGGSIFWALFHSHVLFLTNIIQIIPNVFQCYSEQGIYRVFLSYYVLIKEILALVLLIMCGLRSVKNIRRSVRRIEDATGALSRTAAGGNSTHSTVARDRQLAFMLLMDILIYGLFCSTFAIFLLYQQLTQYNVKSPVQIQIESIVRNLAQFAASIPVSTSFYTNMIASKTFRNEVKKAFSWTRILCIQKH
ncbi:unnamed protein product [Adineta ricciae]|uniref:G-protein coupled receptors family 1 profile domain-containing protein n=1 Tax=Adineta ricciae TaxID=249248 RepID=A0A815MY79_ADIRI|nr:unnamed protein product [Adineta ricciae]